MRLLLASSLLYLLLSLAVTQSASPLSSSTPSTTPTTSQPLALQSPCRVGSFHDTTSNELLQENECRPLTLIFARGSQEVGNMGTRVGPSLARAMQALLGPDRVTVQGVNEYPAILYEALHGVGSVSGSRWLAEAIRLTKEKCPETYLAIGGYSQGAMLIHNALHNLTTNSDSSLPTFIKSIILFGDPDRGTSLPGLDPHTYIIQVCYKGDGYCRHDGSKPPYLDHLAYCKTVPRVAEMIVGKSGLMER